MLKISKLTDYAILILGYMAKAQENVLCASFLAKKLNLTVPTVSKILKNLSEHGVVSSVRGADGGYYLTRKPQEITLADILHLMEGGVAMTACCEKNVTCIMQTSCTMQNNWMKINQSFYELLNKITIIDMLTPLSIKLPMINHKEAVILYE